MNKDFTVYLGGPMRGHDQSNFPEFFRVTKKLREYGIIVLSPAEHDREMGFDETLNSMEGFDLEAAFAWDLAAIERADAVVFLKGWQGSTGCGIEYAHARKLGRPVYEYQDVPGGVKLKLVID